MVKVVRKGNYDEFRADEYDQFHEAIPGAMSAPRYGEREVIVERTQPEVIEHDHAGQTIYLITGIVEALLALRLMLRLLGASLDSGFVQAVYLLSAPLVRPFAGMFNLPFNEATARLEVATVFAMVFYAILGYLLIRLVRAIKGREV